MNSPLIVCTQEQLEATIREAFRAEAALLPSGGAKEVLTLAECAELLGRHPKTVSTLVRDEGLPCHLISEREPRFFRSEVLDWLRARSNKPQEGV